LIAQFLQKLAGAGNGTRTPELCPGYAGLQGNGILLDQLMQQTAHCPYAACSYTTMPVLFIKRFDNDTAFFPTEAYKYSI